MLVLYGRLAFQPACVFRGLNKGLNCGVWRSEYFYAARRLGLTQSMATAFSGVSASTAASWPSAAVNQRRSGGLCAPVHGSHSLERADHARRPQQAVLITGPCHRRTDKLALTISIAATPAQSGRPARHRLSPRVVDYLAGSLCRPRRTKCACPLSWLKVVRRSNRLHGHHVRSARSLGRPCGRVRPAD